MDFEDFPPVDEPLLRLAAYQRARDDEKERVEQALAKPPEERTKADWNYIAYSPYGTASSHGY